MNKCELILAMIAGMFQAVFKGVRYQIHIVMASYELTVFIPKRGTYRPLVESIAHLVSEHLSLFAKWLPDSFVFSKWWELTDGAESDDICSNNEDYLLYTIRIVKIEEPAE